MSETPPTLSDEQMLEKAKGLFHQLGYGGASGDPDLPAVRRPAESVPTEEGIFTIADLGPALLDKGLPYTMPNGKRVYVHALSQRDQQRLIRLAGSRRDREQSVGDPMQARVLAEEITRDVQVFTVILACRTGEERTAPEVFQVEDFGALRAYLKAGVVSEICQLVDTQSGAPESLPAGVRRFFMATQRLCETLLSRCGNSTEFPESLRVILTRYGSLASRATKQGGWDSGMETELNDLLTQMG
jgi:hypothetical protein